jgi:hypothetical protein
MTSRDDERPGERPTEAPPSTRRPGQRRALAAAGVVGLAAVLGGGAYLTTSAIRGNNATTTLDTAAIGPAAVATTAPDSPPPSASATASAVASPTPATSTTATPSVPPEVAEQIKEARENGKKFGVKVMRPVTPTTAAPPPADLKETTTGSIAEGGIVRVMSGHGDLTGQGELGYVAGGISKYRGNECSQTYQFATDLQPKKRQNMLMCWRITAQKSVAAIVVDYKGHPSRDKAAEAIDAQWQRMG